MRARLFKISPRTPPGTPSACPLRLVFAVSITNGPVRPRSPWQHRSSARTKGPWQYALGSRRSGIGGASAHCVPPCLRLAACPTTPRCATRRSLLTASCPVRCTSRLVPPTKRAVSPANFLTPTGQQHTGIMVRTTNYVS